MYRPLLSGIPLSRQLRENNLAGILVFISLLFVLCQSAKIVPDMYEVRTRGDYSVRTRADVDDLLT